MKYRHIGILSAMPEEIGTILEDLEDIKKVNFGDLNIYSGEYTVLKEGNEDQPDLKYVYPNKEIEDLIKNN